MTSKNTAAKNIAVVFPGQGSQSVGMSAELYQEYAIVRETYAEAAEVLGFDLWSLIVNGPAEQLNQTVNTQPAMLVAGVACWRALQAQQAFTPSYFAGHSLGEYTALVASGQLAFAEAVRLASQRAQAMQAAVPVGTGAMAAVLGLDADTIGAVCAEVSSATAGSDNGTGHDAKVWMANDNAPGQIVIAGHKTAVDAACKALKTAGAKRVLPLPVSVPSHCPLMQPAADTMQAALMLASWSVAIAPVIHNCSVAPQQTAEAVVAALTEQLVKPVRWVETVQYFAEHGVETVIEVGPGKVLSGLTKRIDRRLKAISLYDSKTLAEVLRIL